jgi:hypothetical protein
LGQSLSTVAHCNAPRQHLRERLGPAVGCRMSCLELQRSHDPNGSRATTTALPKAAEVSSSSNPRSAASGDATDVFSKSPNVGVVGAARGSERLALGLVATAPVCPSWGRCGVMAPSSGSLEHPPPNEHEDQPGPGELGQTRLRRPWPCFGSGSVRLPFVRSPQICAAKHSPWSPADSFDLCLLATTDDAHVALSPQDVLPEQSRILALDRLAREMTSKGPARAMLADGQLAARWCGRPCRAVLRDVSIWTLGDPEPAKQSRLASAVVFGPAKLPSWVPSLK